MAIIPLLAVKRFLPHIIGGGIILAAIYAIYSVIYEKGYQAAVMDYNAKSAELAQEAVDKAGALYRVQLVRLQQEHESEITRLRQEQVITTQIQTVTEYVDRIVVKTECTALATDVVGVLSKATDAVNTASSGRAQGTYKF